VDRRRAAIRYVHFIAGCPVPTAEAAVAETIAGMRRDGADRGELPAKKLAATADLLRQILAPIPDDLRGLRDRALLLLGFAGALRRAEHEPERARDNPAPAPGSVRAKTGTLDHVATLAGYLGRPDGVLVLSLMYNGRRIHAARAAQWDLFRLLGAEGVNLSGALDTHMGGTTDLEEEAADSAVGR